MTTATLDRIKQYITRHGRPLDVARLHHNLRGGDVQEVLGVLGPFQNPDGGFGHALEADLRMPGSSPIATWIGLELLIELDVAANADIVRHGCRSMDARVPVGQRPSSRRLVPLRG